MEVAIGVKSASLHLHKRLRMRETWMAAFAASDWAAMGACVAFIIGE
jgi:hypothetical protein